MGTLARLAPNTKEEVFDFGDIDHPVVRRVLPSKRELAKKRDSGADDTHTPFDPMVFADYDHDGAATEFTFRVPVTSGGPSFSVLRVIGVSKKNPKLHFFDTPGEEHGIELEGDGWEQVRKMKVPGKLSLLQYDCDVIRGVDKRLTRVLQIDASREFHAEDRSEQCAPVDFPTGTPDLTP